MATALSIKTWATSQIDEDGMNGGHAIFWRRMIELISERSLAGRKVLDFGCNQGGLLRMLHQTHGYASALGVDIAEDSIAKARALSATIPAHFEARRRLSGLEEVFDLALSHEVLYLLPDLARHAKEVHACLKPGGVYYAAIGCHTDNPQWSTWKPVIQAMSNLPIQDYGLNDYASAFEEAGFLIFARPFQIEEFVPIKLDCALMSQVAAKLAYCNSTKVLFRLVKPS